MRRPPPRLEQQVYDFQRRVKVANGILGAFTLNLQKKVTQTSPRL